MRARRRSTATKTGCFALALLLALHGPADARTRRCRKHSSAPLVLQPFLHVRSAVHSAIDPIVWSAPRLISRAATAPIRGAFRGNHDRSGEALRAEALDQNEADADADSTMHDIRIAPRLKYDQEMRVAYVAPSTAFPPPPRAALAKEASDAADGQAQEQPRRIESGGSHPMVSGDRAILRRGIAYAPSRAPQKVKSAIWAANTLRDKPYLRGGGHASFYDRGYDCSGTVSFVLHHAGALATPLPASNFQHYGERGRGRWITIYSRSGHTFADIAGLRLDTTDFQNGGNTGPSWHVDGRDTGGYVARHPAGM